MASFSINFWGVKVRVSCFVPDLDSEVAKLLLPIWRNDPSVVPEATFQVRMSDCGEIVVEGPDPNLRHWSRYSATESLERRLHMYLASQTQEVVYVHAGVVSWQEGAVLLPGRSFTGKTTLVQALVKMGADFLSDEYAIIDRAGMVHPFPRPLSIRDGTQTRRVSAENLRFLRRVPPLPVSAVLIGRFQQDGHWSPVPGTRGQAVLELLSNTVTAQARPQLSLQCLTSAVTQATVWQSDRGEAEESARLILAKLNEEGGQGS